MDENPVTHPGVPGEMYHVLGKKTLLIFALGRIQGSFVLLLVSIGLFVIRGQGFFAQTPVGDVRPYFALAALGVFALFIIFFLLSFLVAWLVYINYKYCLGEDSLKIKRGIFDKEEIAIPYRQIQDVNLDRPLVFRLMGVSRIIILTAGHDDESKLAESTEPGQSEGILPALDRDLAEWLQAELLKRANVQKVVEVKQ